MPKLSNTDAARVEEAETTSFEPLPVGTYPVRLNEVTVSDREGASGFHYWRWELEVDDPDDDTFNGRKMWTNTSLSPKADFKMKETFEAFGFTTDTDTDEIVGERCLAAVVQRVIEGGTRAGQTGNDVQNLMALPSDGEAPKEGDPDWVEPF